MAAFAVVALLGSASSQGALTSVTVAADGSGNFKTVQEAINAAPNGGTQPYIIQIKPGTYKEKLKVPKEKSLITFQGEDAATTILTYDDAASTVNAEGKAVGTSGSASILIQGPEFHAENITFENSAGKTAGQAVAVNVWSDKAIFRKCRFLGWQDTLLVNRNRQYFENCYIAGSVDYVFGGSAAWFERCQLHSRSNGYITAASTAQELPYGYVFSNCKVTAEPGIRVELGRPWRPYGSVTFINTEMSAEVTPAGWNNWGNAENEKTARYGEYKTAGPGANPTGRVVWSKQLSAEEAIAITPAKVLNGWDPVDNG